MPIELQWVIAQKHLVRNDISVASDRPASPCIQDMPEIPDAFEDTLLATKEAEQTCSLQCYKGTTILYLTLGRPAGWRLANWCM